MKLVRARVTDFKSIDDSGWVDIDAVTSMVGKNESGKTAFLGALKRLNPVDGDQEFELKDFPRKGYVRYRRQHEANPATAVSAVMTLSDEEREEVASLIGEGVIVSEEIGVSKNYKNELIWDFDMDEGAMVRHLLDAADLPPEITKHAGNAESIMELLRTLEALDVKPVAVGRLITSIYDQFSDRSARDVVEEVLYSIMPKFVYFDEYSTMHGRISIQGHAQARGSRGRPQRVRPDVHVPAVASRRGPRRPAEPDELRVHEGGARVGVHQHLRRDVRVLGAEQAAPRRVRPVGGGSERPAPAQRGHNTACCAIWNNRHRVSVPFDDRSKGFVWFFSFLTYFSSIEEQEQCDLVLLLDEPGLNLHALAQHDFLRFIDERLAPKHQVVYTTHSAVHDSNLNHLDRIRTVQDVDDRGTVISSDTLSNDQDTVFPLQVALGHKPGAHAVPRAALPDGQLGGGPDLSTDSGRDMREQGLPATRPALGRHSGWQRRQPCPVFVSLLGENYVSVAVLMDVTPKNKEKMDLVNKNSIMQRNNPVKWVEVQKIRTADIEDIFEPAFYLKLVNDSYEMELMEPVSMKAISAKDPRIVQRLERHFEAEGIAGGHFDSYKPAAWLLENHAQLRHEIGDDAIERAVSMFQRVNSLLPHDNFANGLGGHHHVVNGSNGSNGSASRPNGANGSASRSRRPRVPSFTL